MDLKNTLVIFLNWGNTRHMGKTSPEPQSDKALTENIYRLAEARGLSRNKLAELAGIDDTSFYRKLDRKPKTFTVEDLIGLAEALETTPSALLRGA
jgi:DNA-binding Xre family transcriptional regulator